MFRFVHAADLHLDSPLRGLLDLALYVASVLQQATFDAWDDGGLLHSPEQAVEAALERADGRHLVYRLRLTA